MTAIMEETEENLIKMKEIFEAFKRLSGLEINEGKTKVICIGANLENITPITEEVKFKYVTSFTLFGVEIDNKLCKLSENFEIRKKRIRQKIAIWKSNNLKDIFNIPTGLPTVHDGLPQGDQS